MRYVILHAKTPSQLRRMIRDLLGKYEGRLAWLEAITLGGVTTSFEYELVLVNSRTAVVRFS